jgi:hypothetical protein
MANALILHGSFCRIPYAVLQGILEPNLISSREFESRSREFGALPEIPTRRDFVHRARLAAAALAGAGLRHWQSYTALLTMCGSLLSLSLRPRPKAQVRLRSGEWLALARRQHQWPDPAGWGFSTSSRHRVDSRESFGPVSRGWRGGE